MRKPLVAPLIVSLLLLAVLNACQSAGFQPSATLETKPKATSTQISTATATLGMPTLTPDAQATEASPATITPPVPPTAIPATWANWKTSPISIGNGSIKSGEFSPDGKRFAAVTPLGVAVYAVDTLQQLDFISADLPVLAAAFSPDWSVMATARGSSVTIRRMANKQVLATFETEPGTASRLLFSPDGNLAAIFVLPPGEEIYHHAVELWSIREEKRLSRWEVSVYDKLLFAPDGKTFYAWNVSQDAGVRRWQIPSGAVLPVLKNWDPYPVAFSPDANLYAAMSDSGILIQRTSDQTRLLNLPVDAGQWVGLLQFSPDGSMLLAWMKDGALDIWRTADGKLLQRYETGTPVGAGLGLFIAVSADNKLVAIPTIDGIAFYRLEDGSPFRQLKNHVSTIDLAVISPLGDKAAALVGGDGLMVWSLSNGNLLYSLLQVGAISLDWSADGQWLALGGWDGSLRILRAMDGSLLQKFPAHLEQVQSVAFSPDNILIASSSMQSVKVWKLSDESRQQSFSVPGGWVPKVRFSRDGRTLAATSADGKVRVWQAQSGQPVTEILVPDLGSDRDMVDFSPDGSYLAIGETSQIGLWRLNETKPFLSLPVGSAKIITLRISPDGSLLVCGLTDGSIQFWQIPQGKLLQTAQAGNEGIVSLDFSADGRILLSASRDGTLHTWSVGK